MNLRDSKMSLLRQQWGLEAAAVSFDAVRVLYRKERRGLVREVIVQSLSRSEMQHHVKNVAHRSILDAHRDAFIEDVMQDLEQMDEGYSAAFGITPEQLKAWQQFNN